MKQTFFRLLTAAFLLLTLSLPQVALAKDLIVTHNPAGENEFSTIQAAINQAAIELRKTPPEIIRIQVRASSEPYRGPITIGADIRNVPIFGESTAGTTIEGGSGSLPLISLNGATSIHIRNFTFKTANVGISVNNSPGTKISNNVFQFPGGTAIEVRNSSSNNAIFNNTFDQNRTAISTNSDVEITNNIFSRNGTSISTQASLSLVSYNLFFPRLTSDLPFLEPNSIPNARFPDSDPLFVDPGNDFHLREGSPARGSGNPNYPNVFDASSDMGAYGGRFSDPVTSFAPITLLSAALTTPPSTVTLNWTGSSNSAVTAYRIYYGTISRTSSEFTGYEGIGATEGSSPVTVAASATSADLSNLPFTPPAAPATPSPRSTAQDRALQLNWEAVPGASRYLVYLSTAPFTEASLPPDPKVVPGTETSYLIPGLTNGTPYFLAVRAVAQATYFTAVTAVINSALPFSPGSANESSFSNELPVGVGPEVAGPLSPVISDFPEATAPYPNLANKGCFIATAAYGFYSAPQVQLLRDFRDRYLMTNAVGRGFVAWYYRHGPAAAQFINEHPWLKPPVRVALMPLLAGAFFLLKVPVPGQLLILVAMALSIYILYIRLRRSSALPGSSQAQVKVSRSITTIIITALLLLSSTLAVAGEGRPDSPHWSLELKGGAFFPDTANWDDFYGKSYLWEYGAALSYKVTRQLEVGLEGSYARATGKGQLPQHIQAGQPGVSGVRVTHEQVPLNLFVLARGVFSENQWLVPYAGGGYTRMFYRQKVEGQATTEGSVNGYHARGGVQLLLDRLEPETADVLQADFGMDNTYFFVEARYTSADADTAPSGSANIGGVGYLGGFLFEF